VNPDLLPRIRAAAVKPQARLDSCARRLDRKSEFTGRRRSSTLYVLSYSSWSGSGQLFASADIEEFCRVAGIAVREFRAVRERQAVGRVA
jgi:activator of HSP90 ATPase